MSSTELMKQQIIPLFFSPKGRISRGLFWKSNLVLFLGYLTLFIFLILAEQILVLSSEQLGIGAGVIIFFYWYIVFVLTVKRLHDINWSGWLAIPIMMTGIIWIFIGLINGRISPNLHGENPIEYEKSRLYINKDKGLPPPPPPLDNPISKMILSLMIILPIPSLVMAGLVLPDNLEKPTIGQSEPVTSSEKQAVFVDKTLHLDESQYLAQLMNIYNNPKLAPKITACKGDIYCNTFIALSREWKNIPDSYRYKGSFDIKADAKKGITFDDRGRNIGLQRGFYFYNEQTNRIINGVENLENIPQDYEGGLAVLLYIEDKSGWTNDKTNGIFAETQQAEISNDLFLSDNKNEFGIKTTASGLKYKITKEGTGKQPDENSMVTVHYRGQLVSGKVFDSSIERGEPIEFPLNQVIPGWTEGIQLIKEGGKATLYIPSNLGYGEHGVPEMIPPNSPLIFDIELIQVK